MSENKRLIVIRVKCEECKKWIALLEHPTEDMWTGECTVCDLTHYYHVDIKLLSTCY